MHQSLPPDFKDRPWYQRLWIDVQVLFQKKEVKVTCCETFRKGGVACKGCAMRYKPHAENVWYRFLGNVAKRRMSGAEKKYRPNAAIIVTDGVGRVLLCERIEQANSGVYQTVQGGIDAGETAREAAAREMQEELGLRLDQFEIAAELPEKYAYEWTPAYIASLRTSGHYPGYVGQQQTFFLAKIAPDTNFDLEVHHREFSRVFWGSPEELVVSCWEGKRPGLIGALKGFGLLPAEWKIPQPERPVS